MTQISNPHTITEFLLARIAEDEAAAQPLPGAADLRALRECAAKRAIVGEHELEVRSNGIRGVEGCALCNYDRDYGWEEDGPCKTLRALAAVYSDHPDYRQEWALNG